MRVFLITLWATGLVLSVSPGRAFSSPPETPFPVAAANVEPGSGNCDPAQSKVPPLLLLPNNPNALSPPLGPNSYAYTVTFNCGRGPVANAIVEIIFTDAANALIAWCDGEDGSSVNPLTRVMGGWMVTTTTNTAGEAKFHLSAGGCIKATQVNPFTVEVRANGVPLASDIAILSPDAVDKNGQTTRVSGHSNCAEEPLAPGGKETAVSLADATFHTGPFANGVYEACSDLNGSGTVTLADGAIATQFIVNGNRCTCN